MVQMLQMLGIRNLYNQLKRGFRAPREFEVGYWRLSELETLFSHLVGPTSLSVDGYFSANAQPSDTDLLLLRYRFVVFCSEMLRKMSEKITVMKCFADSIYVESIRDSGLVINRAD